MLFAGTNAIANTVTFCNPLDGDTCSGASNNKTLDDLIGAVMNFIFGLAIFICPVFIIWGAFKVSTSEGDENKIKSGKQMITYAVVGLVVIAASNVIKAIIWDLANTK